uniref:Uncharacterized protein n=1 Tax=Oryza sativa subsp. japonica TaxID=39947 RepID=Q67U10_ORYSJ|nr:hypothetical protein [Oryza sativa Japonica Group]BAD38361.1 hypothetical protein [Oryza sativa Japonica Group]
MVVVVVVVMVIVAEGIELEMHLLRKLLQEKPPQDLTAVTEMESPIHMIPLIEMFDLGAARRRRWVADSGGSRKSVCWCHNRTTAPGMGRVDWREGLGTGDGGGDRGSMVDAGIRSSGDDDNLERCVGATAAGEAFALQDDIA